MATLEISGVDKRFGGVQALRDASLQVESGEVHGLLGPNGSGKSTLNKILTGAVRPDRCTIRIDGRPVTIDGPIAAGRHRIAAVYQHLSLVGQLSVLENLTLGVESDIAGWLTPRRQRLRVQAVLDRLRPALEPGVRLDTRVETLEPGTRQVLELGKAVLRDPRFLVLDEATASLHRDQVALVFSLVRELTAEGVAVIFVSHRMEEISELCRRATIIRNGTNVATVDVARTSGPQLVRLMVGDVPLADAARRPTAVPRTGQPALEVRDLETSRLHGVSLRALPGEVIGLGGLQGQGQSELLRAVFGADPIRSGAVVVAGHPVRPGDPRRAVRAGLALVPGDRSSQGYYAHRSILENLSSVTLGRRAYGRLVLVMRRERAMAEAQVQALQIKIGDLSDPVSTLSGGNQQKVVIGKWLPAGPRVALLDDPTKGVDVGAKAEIYAIIASLTAQGVAVLLNSSDDTELAALADRVLVFYEGGIVTELSGGDVTHDRLVAAALRVDTAEPVEAGR